MKQRATRLGARVTTVLLLLCGVGAAIEGSRAGVPGPGALDGPRVATKFHATPSVERQIQDVLDKKARMWNTSFSVAVRTASGLLKVAAGVDNHATSAPLRTTSLIPMGSVTKPFTAAGILRLAEAGKLGLDDPVAPRLNAALSAWNGTTLGKLFRGQEADISKITARHLLGMQAGLQDYDDLAVQRWTYAHPNADFSPFDYLASVNKTLLCSPGECCAYSSIGYILLGVLLAWESGANHWTDFDQLSVLPPLLQTELHSLGMEFPKNGKCSTHPDICHQYAAWHVEDEPDRIHFFDIRDMSCLNAWTCGNIAASPAAVATYFYELFNGKVVTKATLAEMQQWHPFTTGYSVGSLYGLGLFFENYFPTKGGAVVNETATVGHGGMDWGSGASPVGYNKKWDFGIAFAVGAVTGINCTLPDALTNGNAWQDALCPVYDIILQHVSAGSAPRLDCAWQADQDWDYGFTAAGTVKCNYTMPSFTP